MRNSIRWTGFVWVLIWGIILAFGLGTFSTITPVAASMNCSHYVALDGDDANPGTLENPWRTLQYAADTAQPGDEVCVGTGTYSPEDEELIFLSAGTADQPITLTTYNGEVIIQGSVFFEPGSAYWQFHGFTMNDFVYWGISVAGADHIVLSGLVISGGEAGINFSVTRTGDERPVDHITVMDSIIHDAEYTVVDCTPGPCNNMTFQRLEIYGAGGASASYGSDGLAVECGQNILVEDCIIHHNSGDGLDLNSRDKMQGDETGEIIVRRNRVEQNALNGIKLWGGGTIVNNLAWNNGDTNLVIEEGSDYTIINNTFASVASHTYLAAAGYDEWSGTTNIIMVNNIFYNDNPAMTGSILYISPRVNLNADYNLYYNPYREEDMICHADECFNAEQINDGTFFSATGYGEHSIYGDPLFVDAAVGDFHLSSTSPALNAGNDTDVPKHDIETNPRPIGSAPDLGAYEADS